MWKINTPVAIHTHKTLIGKEETELFLSMWKIFLLYERGCTLSRWAHPGTATAGPSWPLVAMDCTQAVLVSAKARTKSGSNQGAISPSPVLYLYPVNTEGICESCQKTLRKVPPVLKAVKQDCCFQKASGKGSAYSDVPPLIIFKPSPFTVSAGTCESITASLSSFWEGKDIIPLYFRETRCTRMNESWKFVNIEVQLGLWEVQSLGPVLSHPLLWINLPPSKACKSCTVIEPFEHPEANTKSYQLF